MPSRGSSFRRTAGPSTRAVAAPNLAYGLARGVPLGGMRRRPLDGHPGLREGEVDEVSLDAKLGCGGEAFATHGFVEFQLNRRHPYVASRSRYLDRLGSRRRFTLDPPVIGLAVDRPDNRLGSLPELAAEQGVEESHVKPGHGRQGR